MTTFCIVSLVIALAFYLAAALLFQGHFPLAQERLGRVGTQELEVGSGRTRSQHRAALRVFRQALFANMVVIITSLVMAW